MLDREQYQENVVENDEQFTYSVERFEFELFDHFKTNKVVVSIKPSLILVLVYRNNTRFNFRTRGLSLKLTTP